MNYTTGNLMTACINSTSPMLSNADNSSFSTSAYCSNISNISSNSSSSRRGSTTTVTDTRATVIFQSFVILIGLVGSVANGTTLFAVVRSKCSTRKDRQFLLIQISVDFLSCIFLALSYTMKLPTIVYKEGDPAWFTLCIFLGNGESLLWTAMNISTGNLMVIAVERYLMIVHTVFHRNHYRPWMAKYISIGTFIFGIVQTLPVNLSTSKIVNGQCVVQTYWISAELMRFRTVAQLVFIYILPVVVFGVCYYNIVRVIRGRMKIYSVKDNNPDSASKMNSLRRQIALVKTFIMIVVCFTIFWGPVRIYFAVCAYFNITTILNARYITVCFAFFNVCLSPLVYATTVEDIKVYLGNRIQCGYGRRQIGVDSTRHVAVAATQEDFN